jgi:ribosomal protein L15
MLNEIKLKQESKHAKKRVGRGMASGTGKTCGEGIKDKNHVQVVKYK